jgi:hypothetical protein
MTWQVEGIKGSDGGSPGEPPSLPHTSKKMIVIPNETANWRWNEESQRAEQILKKQNLIPNGSAARWRNEESQQQLQKQNK